MSFNVFGDFNNLWPNSNECKESSKVCSYIFYFNKIGNFKESVKLSKSLIKAVFIVKYIINLGCVS